MAKKWALTFGIIFLIVGIIGLLGGWGIVGQSGLFMTDSVHDWVHIISGLIFLIVALAAPARSAITLKILGIVYLIVAILGFFTSPVLGFITVNSADNWLHLILAIVIVWAGFGSRSEGSMAAPMSTPTQM